MVEDKNLGEKKSPDFSDPIRLAFVGRKAAGKTFAAHYLYKNHNFKTVKLKDSVKKLIRWFYQYRPHEQITWERQLEFYDALYALDKDIHVNYLLRRTSQRSTRDIVVDDVRYVNEVNKLKDAGFVIVRISMPDGKRARMAGIKSALPGTVKLNEYFNSTTEAYPVDYSLQNDTQKGLYMLLDNLVAREKEKRGR